VRTGDTEGREIRVTAQEVEIAIGISKKLFLQSTIFVLNELIEGGKMSKGRDRTVSRRPDGKWEIKGMMTTRASSVHDTQKEAAD